MEYNPEDSENRPSSPLSDSNRALALEIFNLMDLNHDLTINKHEALQWWKNNFASLNAKTFFQTVDKDGNEEINQSEWMIFWQKVKNSGYSNEDLEEELLSLKTKSSWTQYEINE